MKFRICLLSIFCCLLSAVQIDAGQNSNAVISLDYVASGQGNQTDDGVISGTVSGRGTTIVVEVFANNVSTSLSAVEILFKSSPVLTYVGAENPNTFIPVNLSNGVALTFANPLTPSSNGDVFLAKAEFTTLVDVANSEFKIGIEKVKLVENINNFDEITSSNEIVFNQSSTTNTLNTFQIVWPMDGDINYDGQVNIPDFLLLVDNFGKTGTVPTSRMAIENALATGGSGTVITIRDTIYQTRTVRDTVYVGQDVGTGLSRIHITSLGTRRENWDGSDPDDDGIQVMVWFRDKNDDLMSAPEIVKVEVTLGKDNDRDDRPDVPLLLDRVVAVFSETDRKTTPYWRIIQERSYSELRLRIPDEIYSHKLDIRTDFRGDRQYGVVDVYITTTSRTFSDRYDFTKLWKPVVPSDE